MAEVVDIINYFDDNLGDEEPVVVLDNQEFDALRVERRGRDALILYKLDAPRKRLDGKRGQYALEYRWLSTDDDNELACVQGSDHIILQRREFSLDRPLFSQFQLF